TLPFLFATLRKGSPIADRIADLIARYATAIDTLDAPLANRMRQLITDQASDVLRWLGEHDAALGALAIHVPGLRAPYLAAIEGAERVSPETLLALLELGEAPGETPELALAMFEGPDATDLARMAAAAFLTRFGGNSPELMTRVDAALPPSSRTSLARLVKHWTPTITQPAVAPKLSDAEVIFTGKKLVVVKADNRSVTLPWEGADVAKGDRLKVGLSAHGQPKLAVVTDWRGNV